VLARDVILATEAPQGLSVRNALEGVLVEIVAEGRDEALAIVDLDGSRLISRVTREAIEELRLRPGLPVWALVKAASLRGHVFAHANRHGAEHAPP
jgi:molybdate transport system ATP-binding protein